MRAQTLKCVLVEGNMCAPILKCAQDPNLYILNLRAANNDTRNQTGNCTFYTRSHTECAQGPNLHSLIQRTANTDARNQTEIARN
jgi:hypothetical protein